MADPEAEQGAVAPHQPNELRDCCPAHARAAEQEHIEPPEHIGYREDWPRTQYGVFEDRRSKGLGFGLIETTEDAGFAAKLASRAGEWPRFLRVRVVTYAPWEYLNLERRA